MAVLPISRLMDQSRVVVRTLGCADVRSHLYPFLLLLLALWAAPLSTLALAG